MVWGQTLGSDARSDEMAGSMRDLNCQREALPSSSRTLAMSVDSPGFLDDINFINGVFALSESHALALTLTPLTRGLNPVSGSDMGSDPGSVQHCCQGNH